MLNLIKAIKSILSIQNDRIFFLCNIYMNIFTLFSRRYFFHILECVQIIIIRIFEIGKFGCSWIWEETNCSISIRTNEYEPRVVILGREWDLSRCRNSTIRLLTVEADLRNVPLLCRPRIRYQRYKFHVPNCTREFRLPPRVAGGLLDKYKRVYPCVRTIRDTIGREGSISSDSRDFFLKILPIPITLACVKMDITHYRGKRGKSNFYEIVKILRIIIYLHFLIFEFPRTGVLFFCNSGLLKYL